MNYTPDQIAAFLLEVSPFPWKPEINEKGELVIHIDDDEQTAVIWCGDMETCTGRDMRNHEFIAAAPAIVKQQSDRIKELERGLILIMDDTDTLSVFLSADANEAHFERLHTIARDALEDGDA